jgi:hypothetical protein
MRTLVLAGAVGVALALMTACSGGGTIDLGAPDHSEGALTTTLNTFITESVEIDEAGGGPGDANLFVGDDPADGSPSYQLPAGGPATFIDWEDLGGDLLNHRLLDTDDPATGRDLSAFPGSNECVGAANVLSKMDLTYVASANNQSYAYLAVQRAANNGDAGYYWLFTRLPPRMTENEPPCKRGRERLVYDISGPLSGRGGDVLVKGHFKPSAEPLLEVYRATRDAPNTDAVNAINYLSDVWELDPDGVEAAAVNTTNTEPGAFGADGVKTLDDGMLEPELFAEAAVPLRVFTGEDGNVCDATFYGSVITRSSGSGGTTPDLKDLAGPALFDFGTASAQAELFATCREAFDYEVTEAIGADGQPITNPTCLWEFADGSTSSACSGTYEGAPLGREQAAWVRVTDPVSGCVADVTTLPVDVFPELGAWADLTATCTMQFAYDGGGTGGSESYTYGWTFSGASSPSSSTTPSGTVDVGVAGVSYLGELTVTDLRTDVLEECVATASDTAVPYAPIAVYLSPLPAAQTCPTMTSDAVGFTAFASGGDGAYTYTWSGASCAGAACVIDPSDSDFCPSGEVWVTVDDGTPLCDAEDSEHETWSKTTTIFVSNN